MMTSSSAINTITIQKYEDIVEICQNQQRDNLITQIYKDREFTSCIVINAIQYNVISVRSIAVLIFRESYLVHDEVPNCGVKNPLRKKIMISVTKENIINTNINRYYKKSFTMMQKASYVTYLKIANSHYAQTKFVINSSPL